MSMHMYIKYISKRNLRVILQNNILVQISNPTNKQTNEIVAGCTSRYQYLADRNTERWNKKINQSIEQPLLSQCLIREKTTDLSQATDKPYYIMLYTSPWSRFELTTSVVIKKNDEGRIFFKIYNCGWLYVSLSIPCRQKYGKME
jgi:hypothetical protein